METDQEFNSGMIMDKRHAMLIQLHKSAILFLASIVLFIISNASMIAYGADETAPMREEGFSFIVQAEGGFLSVISHTIRYGDNGTDFDYRDEGGQDLLFPCTRFFG